MSNKKTPNGILLHTYVGAFSARGSQVIYVSHLLSVVYIQYTCTHTENGQFHTTRTSVPASSPALHKGQDQIFCKMMVNSFYTAIF